MIGLLVVAVCALESSVSGADRLWLRPGTSSLEISPVIIQKELGRFLWLIDTRVGQFVVGNPGATPVVLRISSMGLAHDENGGVITLPCPSEVAAALTVSPSTPISIAPGASVTIKVLLDRSYAGRPDRSGLCAALIVSGVPARCGSGAMGIEIGSSIVLPVMVKLPGRGCARLAMVGVCCEGAWDGKSRPALTVRVANEGGAYARVDGQVLIRAADGSLDIKAAIVPALVLPGCVRACAVDLPSVGLPPGAYQASVQLRADGKAAASAEFTLHVGPETTASFPGRL